MADPVGVVCGITPVTNPTSTVLFKCLISLKTRNPIIFAFHPSAQNCSKKAAQVMLDAAVKAGAPANCIQWIEHPSMDATSALMKHDGIATILATGGNSMVKSAYSCGKPALGVGAGNVPAYIEKSADIKQAVNDIVLSKAFDNGMICASEQAVIIDSEIYDFVKEYIKITDVTYHEINQILDRIEKWEGKTVKECILSDTLKRFVNKEDFKQWHVLFLIKLAEVSNSFPDENAKKALEYCNLAQRYYEQYHLEDEYVRSRMYHARYESMSNDLSFGYEEKIEVQKKCNYQLLAEREICGSSCSEEKKIDIWKDAARQYGYMDDFEKEIICLKHAVEILDPILNQYDYSKFNRNYSYIMRDLIRAYIRVGHTKSAMDTIRILYVNLIHFIFETENEEEFVDKVRNMSTIGEFLEEINENETAIRIYTAAIYLEIEKSPDIRLVRKLFMTEDTLQLLCESILCQIENGVEQEAVDTIVDLNEKVLQIMEKIDHPESYQLFVKKIKEKYQYQDIEFRKR